MTKRKIILASNSPRRHDLLLSAGIEHEVLPTGAEEAPDGSLYSADGGLSFAEWYALECAKIKSAAARRAVFGDGDPGEDGPLVITADTVVSPDGVRIFGKPADGADATLMLKTLSGTKHQVVGGICVTDGRKTLTATVTTYVKFRELGDREIEDYVSTGEPFGKAGSYAIQETGDHFVEMIDGDYPNIVGLSLDETQRMLAAFD